MKSYLNKFLLILIGTFPSCALLIEEDLTDKEIFINQPVDGTVSSRQSQTFWWENIDGTLSYNLQVFIVDSNQIEEIIADTNLVKNKFIISLNPGEYNWRIRAWNNYSSTDFFSHRLTILESPSLTEQEVVLISPVDFGFKKDTSIFFKWYALSMAENYILEIRSNNWQGSLVYPKITTSYDTMTLSLQEGVYQWGVMAQNEISTTEFSIRNLTIDTKNPYEPILSSPIDSTVYNKKTIEFSWIHPTPEDENFLLDTLIVSSDSLFHSSGIVFSKGVSEKKYSVDINSNGKYFWRVKSIDKAGNHSEWSIVRSFFITL